VSSIQLAGNSSRDHQQLWHIYDSKYSQLFSQYTPILFLLVVFNLSFFLVWSRVTDCDKIMFWIYV